MLFFKSSNNENKGYSGSESYKYIDELLNRDSSKIKIITPFIGDYYAKMLKEIAKNKKKKVYLIIAGNQNAEQINKNAINILAEGKPLRLKTMLLSISILYFVSIFLLKNFLTLALTEVIIVLYICIIGSIMIYAFIKQLSHLKGSNLKLKIVKNKFIHEKVYITDNIAISGSANLTYSGTHKNIEHIDIIKNREQINELEQHFDKLWSEY
ncbi:MAG: phospholipase D-like domain-containing protein [Candidatus Marsarchaeota archaeon]|nr:phospholipase D-like domain-containing protein [Candidatus Marsarchaeota archaeon]